MLPVLPALPIPAHRMRQTHRSGPHSRRPGRTSRRWGCSARWHMRTGWGSRSELARGQTDRQSFRSWRCQGPAKAVARHSGASSPAAPRGRGRFLTRAGGVGLVLIVPAVVVPIAEPAVGDAAVVLALEAVRGAGVLVCGETHSGPALLHPTPNSSPRLVERKTESKGKGTSNIPPQPLQPTPLLELGRRHKAPGCTTPIQPLVPHLEKAQPQSCCPSST